jgi:hypothetical protein
MSENELTPLERALRGLTPSAAPLNRDTVMFQAGRASAPPSRLWPVATAACSLVALGFGFVLAPRSAPGSAQPAVVQQVIVRPQNAPAPSVEPPTPPEPSTVNAAPLWEPPASQYDQVRENVLHLGLDGLPTAPQQRRETTRPDLLLRLN